MKHYLFVLLAALAAMVIVLPGCEDIRYDIQITLDDLVDAGMKRDAEKYIRLLDPHSLDHYDRLLVAARSATRAQIARLPAVDRFDIAVARGSLTGEQLRQLDARGIIRATAPMWDFDGRGRRPDVTIGRIKHQAPRAQAELLLNGRTTNIWLEFVKADDRWYVSDRAFGEIFNEQIREQARRQNRTEDGIIIGLAVMATGRNFDDRIWDAPPR